MVPPSVWLIVLFVAPLLVMAAFTFRAGSFGPQANVFTLDNYRQFLANTVLQELLLRSIWISLLVAIYSVVLAFPVAYFLSFSGGPARVTLLTILIIPAWTSYLLRVLSWKIILGGNGLLSSFFAWVGLGGKMPVLLYNQPAVIITLVYSWIPFVALPIFAALERLDRSLLEAAADTGATPLQAFWRVTLPLSLPGVIAGFLFAFIPTVGEYVTPSLVGGTTGIMYGNLVLDQFMRGVNWPFGSLMSLAMLLAVLIPIAIFARFVRLSDLAGL
jgi:spermidine/putrescine transport system permease protein